MIGNLLAKIRKDKNISKTELAKSSNINIGHLTHIEKEERNPSHKALKNICKGLNIPFQPLMYTYDIKLTEEQQDYKIINHINYDSIPMFDNFSGFAKCPSDFDTASICIKVLDNSMEPKFIKDDYIFIQFNVPLSNKDIGLFEYNNQYIIRKFIVRKNDLVLRAEQENIEDIILTSDDKFTIVGKVLGKLDK